MSVEQLLGRHCHCDIIVDIGLSEARVAGYIDVHKLLFFGKLLFIRK